MSENYQLVYQSRRKCEIYRDTGAHPKTFILYLNFGLEGSNAVLKIICKMQDIYLI